MNVFFWRNFLVSNFVILSFVELNGLVLNGVCVLRVVRVVFGFGKCGVCLMI